MDPFSSSLKQSLISQPPIVTAPFDRDHILKAYEPQLTRVLKAALRLATFDVLSARFGFCTLAWGLFGLIAPFSPVLSSLELYFVLAILALASKPFQNFSSLSRTYTYSADPLHLNYDDKPPRTLSYHRCSRLILALPSLLILILRFIYVDLTPLTAATNLIPSLFLFYMLALGSASLALISAGLDFFFWQQEKPTASLCHYHSEVYRQVMECAHPPEISDAMTSIFRAICQDFGRNVQPLTIKKKFSDSIQYMYANRLGADTIALYLQSPIALDQLAAANIVGFWAEENGIESHRALLSRLLEKLESATTFSQIGWAAANSFGALARIHPLAISSLQLNSGKRFLDVLVSLFDSSNSMSLVLVRTMISLLSSSAVVESLDDATIVSLENKLREASRLGKRQRTRVMAAFCLKLLGRLSPSLPEDTALVADINPMKDGYFLSEEKEMLEKLRYDANLPPYNNWHNMKLRYLSLT